MIDVVLQKRGGGAAMRGYLVAEPEVGQRLVFVRLADSRQIITSEIAAVSTLSDDELAVETVNSCYRIRVIWISW